MTYLIDFETEDAKYKLTISFVIQGDHYMISICFAPNICLSLTCFTKDVSSLCAGEADKSLIKWQMPN